MIGSLHGTGIEKRLGLGYAVAMWDRKTLTKAELALAKRLVSAESTPPASFMFSASRVNCKDLELGLPPLLETLDRLLHLSPPLPAGIGNSVSSAEYGELVWKRTTSSRRVAVSQMTALFGIKEPESAFAELETRAFWAYYLQSAYIDDERYRTPFRTFLLGLSAGGALEAFGDPRSVKLTYYPWSDEYWIKNYGAGHRITAGRSELLSRGCDPWLAAIVEEV